MNDKEDSAWVFDSLVGFLQGPIWSAPLLTFIEERSLIFESDTEDSAEYREIYQEYKNLVDLLLGCYMEDMGITPEQFEHACALNKNTKMPVQFQQSLFEQIWAANEYEIFKRMMIQKNLELQLQALSLIEQKYGLTPASLTCEADALQDDELVMEELLHKHMLEERRESETELDPDPVLLEEHQRLASQYNAERELLQKALRESANSTRSHSPEPEQEQDEAVQNQSKTPLKNIPELKKLVPLDPIPVKPKSNDDKAEEIEIKKRQDYLKAQRDKLVALKKQARSQRLETNGARPSSARVAAKAAINGKKDYEDSEALEPSKIQVRKALAARLKAEVVHN
ncbi:cilia- and flagella-associated protein 36 isoform X2 [Cephus cinctus]|uniref:Cilia- and flagella-associated protein 36 n=1 Tax=Cephus cinctus TaxID=211228 RepID=A0AAJ7BPH3_CEPCN|nr:cilia- and flagella-associated protein 36 isoform X2 [Cephus cinctus]